MADKPTYDIEEGADRLRRLQRVMGYPEAAGFAAYLGVSTQRWGNLVGPTPIPLGREMAFLIVQKCPGVTTDWLWFGKEDGMPVAFARALDRARASERH